MKLSRTAALSAAATVVLIGGVTAGFVIGSHSADANEHHPEAGPSAEPNGKPGAEPSTQPSGEPSTKPSAEPTAKPTCGGARAGTGSSAVRASGLGRSGHRGRCHHPGAEDLVDGQAVHLRGAVQQPEQALEPPGERQCLGPSGEDADRPQTHLGQYSVGRLQAHLPRRRHHQGDQPELHRDGLPPHDVHLHLHGSRPRSAAGRRPTRLCQRRPAHLVRDRRRMAALRTPRPSPRSPPRPPGTSSAYRDQVRS